MEENDGHGYERRFGGSAAAHGHSGFRHCTLGDEIVTYVSSTLERRTEIAPQRGEESQFELTSAMYDLLPSAPDSVSP
jgi:hypothetical protein